jgi:hypothetical protein
MSYDLDSLHNKYAVQIASVAFTASAGRSSVTLVTAASGQAVVIHQVLAAASVWSQFVITESTAAATTVWQGNAGQTTLYEPTRVLTTASTTLVMNATGIGADAGNGFIRIYFTRQAAPTSGGANIGNL